MEGEADCSVSACVAGACVEVPWGSANLGCDSHQDCGGHMECVSDDYGSVCRPFQGTGPNTCETYDDCKGPGSYTLCLDSHGCTEFKIGPSDWAKGRVRFGCDINDSFECNKYDDEEMGCCYVNRGVVKCTSLNRVVSVLRPINGVGTPSTVFRESDLHVWKLKVHSNALQYRKQLGSNVQKMKIVIISTTASVKLVTTVSPTVTLLPVRVLMNVMRMKSARVAT
jgi:hypothetical protein